MPFVCFISGAAECSLSKNAFDLFKMSALEISLNLVDLVWWMDVLKYQPLTIVTKEVIVKSTTTRSSSILRVLAGKKTLDQVYKCVTQ